MGGREGEREGEGEGGREGWRDGRERVELEGESGRNGFDVNPQYEERLQGERQRLCCMYRYLVPCRAVCCSSSGPTLASILRYLMSMACSVPPQATAATVLLQWNL